tara:strand:+ start:43 stop:252 length:210 start_codon:yes stop_codon:yes gene_type:complete
MKQITKYKMDKQTFNEYVDQGILVNIQEPTFIKYRTALIKCDGHTTKTKTMPVEIIVNSYYPKPLFNLK